MARQALTRAAAQISLNIEPFFEERRESQPHYAVLLLSKARKDVLDM
jgi:hypothetical protein